MSHNSKMVQNRATITMANQNTKSYSVYRMMPSSMTLNNH